MTNKRKLKKAKKIEKLLRASLEIETFKDPKPKISQNPKQTKSADSTENNHASQTRYEKNLELVRQEHLHFRAQVEAAGIKNDKKAAQRSEIDEIHLQMELAFQRHKKKKQE